MNRLLGCLFVSAVVAGCSCNVPIPEDPDSGVAGGSAGGGNTSGGSVAGGATAGGTAGGSTGGGDAGGSAGGSAGGMAGGDAGGMAGGSVAGGSVAGGSVAGGSVAGGDAGGMAGGSVAGGSVAGGSVAGGSVAGGSVAGGSVAGGSVAGGSVAGGSVAGGSVAGGSVAGGSVAGGSVAGGSVAGGSVAGGSVAGGSVAGGVAGGSVAGGTAGGGVVMQDTYVCGTCANALDTNPGTQTQPVRTITRGIQLAQTLSRPTVFVGSPQGTPSAYAEAIVVPAGVTIQGRWVVSGTFAWTRSLAGARTLLTNTSPLGVTFAAGATRSAGLDGMRIRASGGISGATGSAGISIIDASPLIFDTDVEGHSTLTPNPITAAGIAVSRSALGATRPNPRIAGSSNTTRATVAAGAAVTNSLGIIISDANVEVEFVDVRSNNVSGTTSVSSAIQSTDAAGSRIRSSSAHAGVAQLGLSSGIAATGNVSGLEIQNVDARGCTGVTSGMASPAGSFGIGLGSCTSISPGGAQPRVTGSFIQGGLAQGTNSYAVGIVVTNGCAPQLDNNRVTGSVAIGLVPQSAAGIACTHEPRTGVPGLNSACRVTNNQVTAGRALATSLGLTCIGNCATSSDPLCAGSCGEAVGNTFSGSDAPVVFHGFVQQSSPRLAKNTFGEGTSFCTTNALGRSSLTGLYLQGAASRVENNVVIAANCPNTVGIAQANASRLVGTPIGPDVHSNTVLVAGAPGLNTSSFGVSITSPTGGAVPFPPTGSYRNNLLQVQGIAASRFVFQETTTDADPAVLENNDFWIPLSTTQPPLYLNEGTTTFNLPSQINGLNGNPGISSGALSNDPMITGVFRLGANSPMRGAGVTSGMPRDDFDSQMRPLNGNTPDIGADEIQ